MEQGACYRFAEAEVMPLAEFEHAPDCFFPASWLGSNIFLDWRERILLHDALKILRQRHASGLGFGKKPRFDLRPECEGDGHRILSRLLPVYGSFASMLRRFCPQQVHASATTQSLILVHAMQNIFP